MSTTVTAIALATVGGLCEVAGILTVVREIASDRDRAKRMLSEPRNYTPPERHYPAKLGSHSFGAGGYGGQGVVASTMRPSTDHQITRLAAEVGNGLLAVREMTDEELDRLEGALLEEIDTGYNELRADLRTVGGCVSVSIKIGPLGGNISGCVQGSSSGDVGVTGTVGPPGVSSPEVSAGPGVEVTNADHISQLGGPFWGGGGMASDGVGGYGETFTGSDGCGKRIVGALAGPAVGEGGGVSAGPSYTVQASFNVPSLIRTVVGGIGSGLEWANPF